MAQFRSGFPMQAILLLRDHDGSLAALEFAPTDITIELRHDYGSRSLEEHVSVRGYILRRFVVDDEAWIPERAQGVG